MMVTGHKTVEGNLFVTDDGFSLQRQDDGTWTDGDMTFKSGPYGLPVSDITGELLEGTMHGCAKLTGSFEPYDGWYDHYDEDYYPGDQERYNCDAGCIWSGEWHTRPYLGSYKWCSRCRILKVHPPGFDPYIHPEPDEDY